MEFQNLWMRILQNQLSIRYIYRYIYKQIILRNENILRRKGWWKREDDEL